MNKQTLPMQGRLPDFLRMQASRDSKPVRENLMSQAADALEAQEKRIRELEGALRHFLTTIDTMTSLEFRNGADREAREYARRILAEGGKP